MSIILVCVYIYIYIRSILDFKINKNIRAIQYGLLSNSFQFLNNIIYIFNFFLTTCISKKQKQCYQNNVTKRAHNLLYMMGQIQSIPIGNCKWKILQVQSTIKTQKGVGSRTCKMPELKKILLLCYNAILNVG